MAKLVSGDPAPLGIELRYTLSSKGIDDHLIETGEFPSAVYVFRADLSELPRGLRPRALALHRRLNPPKKPVPPGAFDPDELADDWFSPEELYPQLDEPTDDAETIVAAWEKFHELRDAEAQKRQREADLKKAIEEGSLLRFRMEMAAWIREHGSERLKLAQDRGYKVSGAYVRERAAMEFPRFQVDTTQRAKWTERTNPSDQALALETEALNRADQFGFYSPRIVWLVRDLDARPLPPASRREVIVIPEYLGMPNYTLIGEVEPFEVTT